MKILQSERLSTIRQFTWSYLQNWMIIFTRGITYFTSYVGIILILACSWIGFNHFPSYKEFKLVLWVFSPWVVFSGLGIIIARITLGKKSFNDYFFIGLSIVMVITAVICFR